PSTFRDVAAVLARYLAAEDVPAAVRARIERGCTGALPETVKPGDPALARAATVVIGGNQDALAAAAAAARAHGYAAEVVAEPLGGDAAEAGRVLAARLDAARGGPFALVAGGEAGNVAERFVSFQGEGAHAGGRQLFVRLGGCPLRCRYCDEPESLVPVAECRILGPDGMRRRVNPFSPAALDAEVTALAAASPPLHAPAVTGGEPLAEADFGPAWL